MLTVCLLGFGGFAWFSVVSVVLVLVSVILDSATVQMDKLFHTFKVWLCFSSCKCVALFC